MVSVPFCSECGEELHDILDVENGKCMDCQMDEDSEKEDE